MVGIDGENSKRQGFTKIDNARVMGVVMIVVVMVAYNMAYKIRIRNISKRRQSEEFATISAFTGLRPSLAGSAAIMNAVSGIVIGMIALNGARCAEIGWSTMCRGAEGRVE